MRVLFFNHSSGRYGASRSLLDLVVELRSRGVEPMVLNPSEGPITELLSLYGIQHQVIRYKWSADRIPNRLTSRYRRLITNLRFLPNLCSLVGQWKPDIIYTNTAVLSIGMLVATVMRKPHLWHLREFIDLDYEMSHDFGRTSFERLLRRSDAIVSNSKAVRDHVCPPSLRSRVNVVYNGIREPGEVARANRMAAQTVTCRPIFVLVGVLLPGKRVTEAIEAIRILHRLIPTARLIIVGDGDPAYVAECRRLCVKLDLTEFVEFVGQVADPYPYYAAACALLVPSRAEAFGRVIVEAMLVGCPVIARAAGGILELIENEESGLLYWGGAAELAKCMHVVACSPKRARQLAEQGLRHAKGRFSIHQHTDNIYKVLRSLFSNDTATDNSMEVVGDRRF